MAVSLRVSIPIALVVVALGGLGAFLLPSREARAQEASPRTFAERSEVTLVEVPVTVTGRDGQPIRGLSPADFELTDEGRRQVIEAVDVADLSRFHEAGTEPWKLPAAGRRHLVFLFDLSNSTTGSLTRARTAAARFIREAMGPADLGAVAAVSIERGLSLLVTFTADRTELARAVETLGFAPVSGPPPDPLAFRSAVPDAQAGGGSVPSGAGAAEVAQPSLVLHQKDTDQYSADQVARQLSALGSLADALDAVSGRKTIVYFSEGFDGRLLVGETDRDQDGMRADADAMLRGQFWNVNVDRRYGNSKLQDVFDRAMALFRKSDGAIYPIDIGGLRVKEKEGIGASRYRREALDAMAQATEGESIHGENDLRQALDRVQESTSLTYVLFFRPSEKRGEGTYHRLKVKIKRSGARVSARAGYYETRNFGSRSPLARALAAADLISQERPADGLPLRLLAFALPSSSLARVPVVAEIPGAILLAAGDRKKLHLGLYFYAVAEDGEVRDYRTRSLSLDLEREAPRLQQGPLRYYAALSLPAGRYRIRVLARDETLGRAGFQAMSLEVPQADTETALLAAPPLFVAAEGGVSLRDGAGSPRASAGPEPLELGGSAFVPQADPSLSAGGSARLCLLLRASPGEEGEPGLEIFGRTRGEGQTEWSPTRLNVVGRTAPDATGLWKVILEFAPGPLPPGRHRLEVTIHETQTRRSSAGETAFQIS